MTSELKITNLLEHYRERSMPSNKFCNCEWRAPRADTVYESLPVNHVCRRYVFHEGPCECPCGAKSVRDEQDH